MKQTVDAITDLQFLAPSLSCTLGVELLDLAVWNLVVAFVEEMFSLQSLSDSEQEVHVVNPAFEHRYSKQKDLLQEVFNGFQEDHVSAAFTVDLLNELASTIFEDVLEVGFGQVSPILLLKRRLLIKDVVEDGTIIGSESLEVISKGLYIT
jgi:hypothetical protein